ncbi:MAG: DUF6364 family protein [Bryobacteraceae bacterium]
MPKTRNLTLHLPADLIHKAKVYAAVNDTSINAVVKQLLEKAVSRQDRTRAAAARFLELARRGPNSDVDPGSIRREEIYERW